MYLVLVLLVVSTLQMMAQQKITGRVIDDDGFAVSYASVQYKGHKIAVSSDGEGKFTIEKKPGLMLTISALSYKTATVKVDEKTSFLEIKLKDDSHKLGEVVVKSKKGRYKRKDNPAVELMRRVIAAKKKSDLSNYDYYQYDKYQKITLALNDITKEQMEEMEENVYLAEFHAGKGHLEQLAELDNRFHEIMYEACDSKILEHQLKDFHQYVLRVRKKTLANANRGPKSNEEHKNIMEAIKSGNADLAEQLAHQHMINAYENMVKNGLHEAYEKEREYGQN